MIKIHYKKYRVTTKNVMKHFFLILRVINAIEILKNKVLLFVLTRHFTTPKRGKEEFLIMHSTNFKQLVDLK